MPCVIESRIHKSGPEIQDSRKRVFQLGDPGHGFDVHGVKREQHAGEYRSGHREPAQQHHDEKRRERVQEDVDEVITEGVLAPELVKEPEGRMNDRVVLLRRSDLEPDSPQSVC